MAKGGNPVIACRRWVGGEAIGDRGWFALVSLHAKLCELPFDRIGTLHPGVTQLPDPGPLGSEHNSGNKVVNTPFRRILTFATPTLVRTRASKNKLCVRAADVQPYKIFTCFTMRLCDWQVRGVTFPCAGKNQSGLLVRSPSQFAVDGEGITFKSFKSSALQFWDVPAVWHPARHGPRAYSVQHR